MKKFLPALIIWVLIIGCSNNKTTTQGEQLSDIEQIAGAYGIENFNKLKKLQYTFNVQRDTAVIVSRTWIWNKISGDITSINNQDTIVYRQDTLNDELKKVDHGFINDKYWLLFPLQLVWDTNMTYTNEGLQNAPISGDPLTKLTIQYGHDGGYTPGDAYDLYLDENWLIREWEFRKGGKEAPGSAITWEDYKDFNGLKIATNHYNKARNFSIFFTGIHLE
jgi:hypothetical protein